MPKVVGFLSQYFPSIEYTPPVEEDDPSIFDEFYTVDENGNSTLNLNASGGVRVALIKHAATCFVKSYGMGVGIGNTEQLAKMYSVAGEKNVWSIHCFLARLIADYGIWALIPLCIIVFYLISYIIKTLKKAIAEKNRPQIAYILLFTAVLLIYPIVSTSSSDAQDLLSMWLYLGVMVRFSTNETGVILCQNPTRLDEIQ